LRQTILGLLATALACRPSQASDARITDSAGVRIVAYAALPLRTPTWVVDTIPRVLLAGMTADSSPVLLDPIGAMHLSDGSIAVADRGASAVKYFDSTGQFERVVGRPGHGPAEFDFLATLMACGGDSAFAYDIGNELVSVIAPDGSVTRRFHPQALNNGIPYVWACSRAGRHIMSDWPQLSPPFHPEPFRPLVAVGLAGPEAQTSVRLGQFLGTEMVAWGRGVSPRVLGRWLRVSMADSLAWMADNATPTVRAYDLAGHLQLELRPPIRERSVGDQEWRFQHQFARDSAASDAGRQRVDQFFVTSPPPKTLPPIQALMTDPAGRLWLRPHRTREDPNPLWQVFSPVGTLLALARLPSRLTAVYEIGQNYILGALEDTDGALVVVEYPLAHSGASGP